MGIVALTEAGDRINSTDFDSGHTIRMSHPKGSLTCPFCATTLFPRDRKGFLLHFVHANACSTKMGHHPESLEHLMGKKMLKEQLEAELREYGDIPVYYEYPLPDAGKHGRIADVAAIFPSGYVLIHEVQLASITTDELEQRTADYQSVGADVIWYFGKSALTPNNIEWCLQHQGVNYSLEFGVADYQLDMEKPTE